MKKLLILVLALAMLVPSAACGSKPGNASPSDLQTPVPPTLPPTEAPVAADALEIMNTIWALYGEAEKFPVVGGDFDHGSEDGPDIYSVADPAALDADFGLPTSAADKVDDAAALRHMMNANTFTGVTFHVTSAGDVQAVADALKDSILQREWLCGFPDRLVILSVDDYVISVFGNEEMVDSFREKALTAYETGAVVYNEPLNL